MYKLEGIEFTENDLKRLYVNNKYIIKYRKVYQINYSKNAGFSLQLIYKQPKNEYLPLTKRGRHLALKANELNDLVGFELVKSDTYILDNYSGIIEVYFKEAIKWAIKHNLNYVEVDFLNFEFDFDNLTVKIGTINNMTTYKMKKV